MTPAKPLPCLLMTWTTTFRSREMCVKVKNWMLDLMAIGLVVGAVAGRLLLAGIVIALLVMPLILMAKWLI